MQPLLLFNVVLLSCHRLRHSQQPCTQYYQNTHFLLLLHIESPDRIDGQE